MCKFIQLFNYARFRRSIIEKNDKFSFLKSSVEKVPELVVSPEVLKRQEQEKKLEQ